MAKHRPKPQFYLLEGHEPVPVTLGAWMRLTNGVLTPTSVASDIIDGVQVSTVFLGINHRYSGPDKPLLFETMIFGGAHDRYVKRASTWEEAESQHAAAVQLVRRP